MKIQTTQQKLKIKAAKKQKTEVHLHSLQLWWTVVVTIALGITYFMDDHRAEKIERLANRSHPLFERAPANELTFPNN